MALEPGPWIGDEFEHRPALLEIAHQWIKENAARVHIAEKGAAQAAIERGIIACFLHHISPYQQVVGQAAIFPAVSSSQVVLFYSGSEQLRHRCIFRLVRRNHCLREAVHQICPHIFHRRLKDGRNGPRFTRILFRHAMPVVPMIHTLAFCEPLPFRHIGGAEFMK
ncbi:hypothetical protein SDC9_184857 [bioreactor metagenome]|uniref:Uncharacterized protein n=1 Tax=bioreactor metagenome TaxID=1076179 RepID=A0A645HF19_9ZZZZ